MSRYEGNSGTKLKGNNNEIYGIILSVAFILFISGMSLFNLFKKDILLSQQENRNLQQKPILSVETLINGSFSKEYASYIADQFPMRNDWMKLKSNIELSMGKKESNGAYLCSDNSLIEGFKRESNEDTSEKIDAVNEFVLKHDKLNTSFMLVPTASDIYKEKLPRYAPVDDESRYMAEFSSKLDEKIKFIDVYGSLNENKNKYIYYKTDHHWTSKGAYIAYNEMCKQLGLEPKQEKDFDVYDVINNFYGTLSSKMAAGIGTPDTISVYLPKEKGDVVVNYLDKQKKVASLYDDACLDEKDKYQVFTGGNHSLINIKSLGDPKKKLLVIKDSYANSFLPFLTAHYGEIDVVDLRYYMDDLNELIDVDGITDVLFLFNVTTFNQDKSILNLSD